MAKKIIILKILKFSRYGIIDINNRYGNSRKVYGINS